MTPSHKILRTGSCRTHGEEAEGGPGIPPDHCHRGLWKGMLLQQRLADSGLALMTHTHHVFRLMSVPEKWIEV